MLAHEGGRQLGMDLWRQLTVLTVRPRLLLIGRWIVSATREGAVRARRRGRVAAVRQHCAAQERNRLVRE